MRLTNMKTSISVMAAAAAIVLMTCLPANAQRSVPAGQGDTFKDTSFIKPPAGAKVCIYEFQDLECPACAHAFPIIEAAVEHYKIPWIERDFPLGGAHIWSGDAAIWARYLQDKVSLKTANEYRGAIFAAQTGIVSKDDMVAFTRRWFQSHGVQVPFVPDPTGQLKSEVAADHALGDKMGLQHTPTIFVASQKEWVQVSDVSLLYQTIDQLLARA